MKILSITLASIFFSTSVSAADLSLTELIVKENLKAGVPYDVGLKYAGNPAGIKEVCFLWSGEGPYCWSDLRVDKGNRIIRTKARTGNPNNYVLQGFVRYGQGQETNKVQQWISVK
jgi:hypothetical protein